ncbi:hypothetical protein P154DRAFT_537442 [Amniculicola lignicola CBS 123094]|uniref:Uncharacterized protein n=1 Tax=Amniculicola lignicola CBS 123094 TaxID=1392246 RepID=A0A6A5W8E1_9PLEO|nr:hypothetical protein P154DRAFT_537442 [Amniculicola lignicola CBS 123094]
MLFSNAAQVALSLLVLNAGRVAARSLVPVRRSGSSNARRAEVAGLDLQSMATFLWADEDGDVAIANLTIYMPGEAENILSMESFDGMTKSIECNPDTVAITFNDDATFAYAQKVWDWVNGVENNSFVSIAGPGDCGDNENRKPFVVSTIAYDEEANKATLAAQWSDWQTVAHTYDLVVGSVAQGPMAKRDIEKSTSIDFNHDLPFSFAVGANGLNAAIACTNCSSTGQFDMEFKLSTKFFVPTGASMKLSPKGVSAIAQVKLSGSGSVTDSLTKEFEIIAIPIGGLNIPGVLELGPFLTVSVGAELSAISITASVTGGATAKLSDHALLEVDLLDPTKNTFSGWEPMIDTVDVKVDASISGGVAVFLKPAIELKAEALGQGFEIGINMKIPNISAKLAAIASSEGACTNPGDPKTTLGVSAGINIGASLNFAATQSGATDPLFTVQLAALDLPLAAVCFPFGDPVAAPARRHSRQISHM